VNENFLVKAISSAISALVMYWMYIPPSYAVIIVLIVTDTIFGGAAAFRDHKFSTRRLMWGAFAKFAAFPMALICDMVEQPLQIGFHIERYFLLMVMAFVFISVVQGYADLNGPGAEMLTAIAQRLRSSLTSAAMPTMVRQVETTTKRIEVEPTEARPVVPPPVTITTTKETHAESVKVEPPAAPILP